jgi:predicted ribosomally synthesized peptide with nif11-like leader
MQASPGEATGGLMSKENVVLFIKHVNKHKELIHKIAKTDKTTDWVKIAKASGFQFTAEEFAAVVSGTLGRKTTAEDAVREYLMAQTTMSRAEVIKLLHDSVIGGEPSFVQCDPLFVRGGRDTSRSDPA